MKIIKTLSFAAVVTIAVALLFQPSITFANDRGDRDRDHEREDRDHRDHRDARVTFRKWIIDYPPCPGVLANMGGVVGGDVGDGIYTGELLFQKVVGNVWMGEALYRFHGSERSFTALVHVEQTGFKAVITGVVTEGWLKGHPLKGEYTQIDCVNAGPEPLCYEGTFKISRDSN